MLLQVPDIPIYRVGTQPGWPLYVPDTPNNTLSVLEGMELWRKTGQRGLLITSYKKLGKKTVIGP